MGRYLPALLIFLLACSLPLPGCGGGGSPGSTPTPTPTPVITVAPRISLGWGERSRATGNLSSALSAVVRLTGARSDGGDLVFSANRTQNVAYSETVTAGENVRPGNYPLVVTFFSDANGTGTPVGVAAATVPLGTDGQLPDVTVVGAVKSVEITAGQQAMVGQRSDVAFTARGDGNILIPVSPGSARFSVTAGADRLRFVGGQAEGILPGSATVIAQVDGISSAPAALSIGSTAVVTVSPNPATLSINAAITFVAQVSNTTNQGVTWSVEEGASGGVIDANGRYTAPATPGTYHVRAVSQYDPEKSATVTVTVEAGNVTVGGDFPPSGDVGVIID